MSIFTEIDLERLESTHKLRERMMAQLASGEKLATGAKDVESLTGLLDSMDRSIFARAKLELDDTTNKVNEETKTVLRELLLDLHKNSGNNIITVNQGSANCNQEYVPSNISITDGELVLRLDNIAPEMVEE